MQRYLAGKMVRREVDKMSKAYFHRQDLSNVDMENFLGLVAQFDAGSAMNSDQKFKVSHPWDALGVVRWKEIIGYLEAGKTDGGIKSTKKNPNHLDSSLSLSLQMKDFAYKGAQSGG